jgi:hypothetical protein
LRIQVNCVHELQLSLESPPFVYGEKCPTQIKKLRPEILFHPEQDSVTTPDQLTVKFVPPWKRANSPTIFPAPLQPGPRNTAI